MYCTQPEAGDLERLLGRKFWLVTVVSYLTVLQLLGDFLLAFLHWLAVRLPAFGWFLALFSDSVIVTVAVGLLLAVVFAKRTWRLIAALPVVGDRFENSIFPDLNGEWDAELHSNWPRIEAMSKASVSLDAPRYDPLRFEGVPLQIVRKKAKINQNWTKVTMTMVDAPLSSSASPTPETAIVNGNQNKLMHRSETIAFDLLRDSSGRPQLAYVFKQENDPAYAMPTSDDEFLGAAFLTLDETGDRLAGKYFQHQGCNKGFNSAGFISLSRPRRSLLRRIADVISGR
ncbi:MAG: hypothetical protein WAT70_01410 [Rhizobiaceae bacterium]